MFNYKNIPNIKLTEIVKDVNPKIFTRMPVYLVDFCKGVEADDFFYGSHSSFYIGSKTLSKFHKQIFTFLESLDAVEFSINDSLSNACIPSPLGITYMGRTDIPKSSGSWKINDIPLLYKLHTGELWLPPHHQAKITQNGKVPESVAVILRGYVEYVLKCKDKPLNELETELSALADAGVLTEEFLSQISSATIPSSAKTNLEERQPE